MAGNVEGDLAGDSEMRAETPGGQESVELAAGEPSGADGENGAGSGEIPGAGAPELEEQAAPQSAADPETEAAQAGAGNDAGCGQGAEFCGHGPPGLAGGGGRCSSITAWTPPPISQP